MNLQDFLEKRSAFQAEQMDNKADSRAMCYDCHRSKRSCVCSFIRPIVTRLKTVILMHRMEARKEKVGTGRPTALCLSNAEIIVGIDFSEHPRVNDLLSDSRYFPMLLYPGKEAKTIDTYVSSGTFDKDKIPLLFLLDGTWPCARKMLKLSTNLQFLPQVTLSSTHTSNFRIKQQPQKHCLSTIESLYHFLRESEACELEHFEDSDTLEVLPQILEEMVTFHIRCAEDTECLGYRRVRYKRPEERKPKKNRR